MHEGLGDHTTHLGAMRTQVGEFAENIGQIQEGLHNHSTHIGMMRDGLLDHTQRIGSAAPGTADLAGMAKAISDMQARVDTWDRGTALATGMPRERSGAELVDIMQRRVR